MARRVFFSFHYENDIWRAGQIRNSWVTKDNRETAGFWDAASWESVQRQGKQAVEKWIKNQLDGTSVTVVLIGSNTAERYYVEYEIKQSYVRQNGMLGVYIHNMRDQNGYTSSKGRDPFSSLFVENGGMKKYLSQIYSTYDWVNDDGYNNLAWWIEQAAQSAGR